MIPIFPAPRRVLDPRDRHFIPGLADYHPGGRYLRSDTLEDVTGQTFAGAIIDVTVGRSLAFTATERSSEAVSHGWAPIIRVNLIRASAGWKWLASPRFHEINVLTTVETLGQHHYAFKVIFPGTVILARYATKTEPRLRPTASGDIERGAMVGKILLRGRIHLVYDEIIIQRRLEEVSPQIVHALS